jgi:hypothetical protein
MIRFSILLSDNLPSKGYDPISPIRHQQMHWVALWVKALGNITVKLKKKMLIFVLTRN